LYAEKMLAMWELKKERPAEFIEEVKNFFLLQTPVEI
jgi:hypothetical protein